MKDFFLYKTKFKWQQLGFFVFAFLFAVNLSAQITGKVVDQETGESLIGASVLISGTSTGTITDLDGNFTLAANQGDELQISYTGYSTMTLTVGSEKELNIELAQGVLIDEVVVTGYSSQRKRDITGAVSVIEAEDLNEQVATSFIQKLEGRASGVQISTSGEPGSGSAVRIRGISSFVNNDPLYIVDGVPTTDAFGTGLNPNDIASIQVLKDASSASIYGARANNGVIIITTRQGKAGKAKVSYDSYVGVQTPVGQYDLITNPADYSEVVWRSHENAGIAIPPEVPYSIGRGVVPQYLYSHEYSGFPGTGAVNEGTYSYPNNLIMASNQQGTDWWDETFDNALMTEHNLNVSGGTENAVYSISAGYLNQQGTMIHTSFERLSLRANSRFKSGRFTFGENFSMARSQGLGQQGGNQSEQNTMTQILKAQAIIPVYDVSGVNFAGGKANGLSNGDNPVAKQFRAKDNEGTFYKILGNAYMELDIAEGLSARSSIGVEFFNNFNQGFSFPTWENSEPTTINSFNETWQTGFSWTWTNTLNYTKTFADVHNVSAFVGYEANKNNFRQIGGSLASYFTTDINAWYLQTGLADPSSRSVNSFGSFSTLASVFGKVDYSYDDRYLVSALVRRDGSSKFGDTKYGVFPAFSVAWRLSKESFLADAGIFDDLKLRFGWGKTGNQQIRDGNTVDRFGGGPESSFYDIAGANGGITTGYALVGRGNAKTKWEENVSTNIGLDASLMEGALNFVVDVYQRTTNGLLFNPALPATAGTAQAPFLNIAKMENRGIDFNVSYRAKVGDVGMDIGLNASHYRNEILDIDGSSETFFSEGAGTRVGRVVINEIGSPIGTFYGYTMDGLFRNQAEVDAHATQPGAGVGRIRFKDLNDDGTIDDEDLGVIGSYHPDLTMGLNIGLTYKNFDATIFMFASIGNDIFNYNKLFEAFRFFNTNVSKDVLTRSFHPTLNPNGDWPIQDENDVFSEVPNSFYVENGSYLRAKNITIGYTLPSTVISNLGGISRVRFYVSAQNAFTITGYEGIDPALSSFGVRSQERSDQFGGLDFGNYPSNKTFIFGVNVGF